MKQIYLLTGNPDKIKAANLVFNKCDIEVLPLELDIPEIQSSSSMEIAHYMVDQAYKMTGKPTVREDHSFFIKDLGFPGPFMTYADKAISPEKLLKIIDTLPSREAYFELGAAYVDEQGMIHEFSYQVPVVMAKELRGSNTFRWERLMMFPGDTRTFAELNADARAEVWTKNFEAIARLIQAGLPQ
ncbi:MAG TPA: non-canonical purine NTP pyrophosphatase [Candidatus Saccharimonadales bacterium]|nr:non-canonical purine NTP pyrophosphatase [Candidatus Saccharimonadales bacterium]